MNILLNAESLKPPLTGIGNYTLNLLRAFNRSERIEKFDCFDGRAFRKATEMLHDFEQLPPSSAAPQAASRIRTTLRSLPLAYKARSVLVNARFGKGAKTRKDFIYHEPNFILKPHSGPSVATIHDLSFLRHPEFHPRERVEWLSRELPRTLQRADLVITDSEVVREELLSGFAIAPERVRAIYLGASEDFHPRSEHATGSWLERHGLRHGQYVAFVATLEPRKGIGLLLDAWERLPQSLRSRYPLVIAGAPGWKNQEILDRIMRLETSGNLKYLRYVPAKDLPLLYAGAIAFVYPSVYEGFGLPVLEAMKSGVPVVCTRATAMAEFSAGNCLLFDAGDKEGLAGQLQHLLEDESVRLDTIIRGLEHARSFSWERCATETLDAYAMIA
jgi:alpha-1,3-rhamnosyl/mannosyltransferase